MTKKSQLQWLDEPAEDNYTAAETFLQLLYAPKQARALAKKLRRAPISEFAARDIVRAAAIPFSEIRAFDWTKQQALIARGMPLSPILIVRQDNGGHLLIADGFHRLCAVFAHEQDVAMRCKVV